MSIPQWLHGVRSTTISGGPSALTPHAAVSSAIAASMASPVHVAVLRRGQLYFSTISQPCISRCSAEQNSVQ